VWSGCFKRVRGLLNRSGYTKWPCLVGVPRHKKKKIGTLKISGMTKRNILKIQCRRYGLVLICSINQGMKLLVPYIHCFYLAFFPLNSFNFSFIHSSYLFKVSFITRSFFFLFHFNFVGNGGQG
jgi:hypothetical protein